MTFMETERPQDGVNLLQITLGCRFGLRVSDLMSLRWKDVVNLHDGDDMVVRERKTNKLRLIRITHKVRTIVSTVYNILDPNPSHFIFTSNKGKGLSPMSVQNFNLRLRTTLDQYGIRVKGNPSSHCLRKTFVVQSIRRGFQSGDHLSLVKVSHLINHSSVSQTVKYTNYETMEMMDLYELD